MIYMGNDAPRGFRKNCDQIITIFKNHYDLMKINNFSPDEKFIINKLIYYMDMDFGYKNIFDSNEDEFYWLIERLIKCGIIYNPRRNICYINDQELDKKYTMLYY